METIIVTLAVIAGGAWLVFAAHRLGQAQIRIDMLRSQRRRDQRAAR